jgi:hypothetical protein
MSLSQRYFQRLTQRSLYNKLDMACQIAFSYLYMPIIRHEIEGYVQTWNSHDIRKQNNRPNATVGKPQYNYYYPPNGVDHYGQPLNRAIVDGVAEDLSEWGKYDSRDSYFDPSHIFTVFSQSSTFSHRQLTQEIC